MRLQKSLDSGWQFIREPDGLDRIDHVYPLTPVGEWRSIVVPGYWQAQFPELARATGAGWYRVCFELDSSWVESDRILLKFGAVSYSCQGWLNGGFIGDHEGGHLGFEWDITNAVSPGSNHLLIRVVSPSGDERRFPDFPFEETLHGKQNWYGPAGGIWQPVTLVANSLRWIESIEVRVRPGESSVDVHVRTGGDGLDDPALAASDARVTLLDPDSRPVASSPVAPDGTATLVLDEIRWWSLAEPNLYSVVADMRSGDETFDEVVTTCGFRTFEAVDGGFRLNGEPITLAGVLDQDYHDGPGVASSKADVIDRFRAIKAMGFNMVRCHIKVPSPMYLEAADEVGLMVWCEPPTTSRLTDAARARIEDVMFGMIARDRHHPSIVIWGIANEAWGYDLVGSAADRSWLHNLFRRVKAEVDDRLIIDNSPCFPNFHIESDVEDYHFYAVIPELRRRWDEFLDRFAQRAAPTFSPHGDAQRSGVEPLVVSEFGAWGLANYECDDAEPWWFESGQEWADGAAYVHGGPERAALWHLDKVFDSWAELCTQTQERQFNTARYQIETMRLRPEIAGYVLTELGDVYWESNGLFDMWGRPRNFTERLAPLNRAATVIGILDRPCIWENGEAEFNVTAINDSTDRVDARLECVSASGTRLSELGDLGPFARSRISHRLTATCEGVPAVVTAEASVSDSFGPIARTAKELLVIPRIDPRIPGDGRLVVPDPGLAASLRTLGYTVIDARPEDDDNDLRVLRRLTDADRRFIESGGAALVLADDIDALGSGFGEFPPVELVGWDDALYQGGSWVSAFSWLRRVGHFAALPGTPIMDSVFEGVIPRLVITGIPPARFEYDVIAGVFVGWVHQVAALVARNPAGLGSLLISTLRLDDASIVEEPLPNWLVHQLIATALE